jgi:threonine 3-dehydrogenase
MTVMIESGLDISKVITHRYHYTDFQKGFDVINSGEASKVILNWE